MNSVSVFACVRMNALVSTLLSGSPAAPGEFTAFSSVFVQVFGDYYHFRHHAVEKRALSSHKGMHIRLLKEPQVRLLSALSLLTVALYIGNKRPKYRLELLYEHVYITREKECQHWWDLVKLCILCSLHTSFHLPPLPRSHTSHTVAARLFIVIIQKVHFVRNPIQCKKRNLSY